MTDCTSQGWGVVDKDGKLNLNTVSATRRAAIVNWLVVERHTMIYGDTTDAEIEDRWAFYREGADVVRVDVKVSDGEQVRQGPTMAPEILLDQIAAIRDEYAKRRRDALDQMEWHAAQGDSEETGDFSTEAERHGAALLACNRILKLVSDFKVAST